MPRLQLIALRSPRAGPFDLSLEPGECLAVTGPSGAGKSLMLRMIADLDPHDGEALLDGRPRAAMPAPDWRRRVVYGASESGWWLDQVGAHFKTPPVEAATALGLPQDIFARPVASCSTGERQRLALLRVLALDAPVLLLDEPTGALDPEAVLRAEDLLRQRLAAGTSILMVTHDPAQANRVGTACAVLEGGRLQVATLTR
ncbi:ABC transporter ATP-binding protein [Lichenicoccus roseus]|uniref:ATP-binding cassette domain-containing protein n=1 Tax=Lichenicoccus roseus TaxID=2683649 RepID=A0A5R9J0A4_9PROT|nr:ABC transporter ATP-binding protein [Lichenicoccus roseus]TLU71105.1 ATP-binding cassette domain-containing protein [Lichenicoccus roseus]